MAFLGFLPYFRFLSLSLVVILLKSLKIVAKYHFRSDDFFGEPKHSTSTDSSQSCIFECLDFKHNSDIRWNLDSLTVGQG